MLLVQCLLALTCLSCLCIVYAVTILLQCSYCSVILLLWANLLSLLWPLVGHILHLLQTVVFFAIHQYQLSNTAICSAYNLWLPAALMHLVHCAVEEATIALIRLYQQFTFRLSESCAEPLELRQAITMAPQNGIPVYVTQRE